MGSVRPGSLNWTASRLVQGVSGKICLTIKKLHLLRKRLWHQWAPATRQTSDPQFYDFQKGCLSLLATAYVLPKSLCRYFLKIFAFGLVYLFNFLLITISTARCSDRKPTHDYLSNVVWLPQNGNFQLCLSVSRKINLVLYQGLTDENQGLIDNYLKSFMWLPQDGNFQLCLSVPHRITFV